MFDHVYFSVCLGSKFDLRELQKLAGEGDYQASAPNFKQVNATHARQKRDGRNGAAH